MKTSEKFRKIADGMEKQIDAKLNNATGQQRPTPRRARIADQMEKEGRRLQKVQAVLYRLADLHESGRIPDFLSLISNKVQIENILQHPQIYAYTSSCMYDAGINTQDEFNQVKFALEKLIGEDTTDPVALQIRKLERDLIGCKIPGFFITPQEVASRLVEYAEIEPGMKVLEPSAGNGSIAQAIRDEHPDCDLDVIEYSFRLAEILKLKGFNIVANDFMGYHDGRYDRIIMNPPFENGQDIEHVIHAYNSLRSGGRIVAIMCEGVFFRQDGKRGIFREWLSKEGVIVERLEAGTFAKELTSAGVSARIVIIDK